LKRGAKPEKQDKHRAADEWLKPQDALISNRSEEPRPPGSGTGKSELGDGCRSDAYRSHNRGLTVTKLILRTSTRGASMGHDDLVIIGRVTGALVIGALIGFERTFHGRPADFRTHSLVCIASSILMIVTVYQNQRMTFVEHDAIRTDPTRMAQGIMTGIGFLGAGVIFKEGLTVRGLTTAASIWVTAAIGILVGIGFWFAAVVGAAAALIVLALFRYIESRRLPSEFYAHHMLRFARDYR
jgi:uncharacterized membrane protein YhiD involved in acid resistance